MGGGTLLVVRLGLRSLATHKAKSLIVGAIMLFGTFLLVLGTATLDSLEASMARSVVSSLAGHLQLYDARARDELALFGSFSLGSEDIGEIDDFGALRRSVEGVDNVRAVVPMGLSFATTSAVGELDKVLAQARAAHRAGDRARLSALVPQLRRLIEVMEAERAKLARIEVDGARGEQDAQVLTEALGEDFWRRFEQDPEAGLEFLDTKVAPLGAEGRLLYFRMLGTDPARFSSEFKSFHIVDGEPIPPGKRGLLLGKRVHERIIKNRLAREFDELHSAVTERGLRIADDPLLQDRVKRLVRLHPQIVYQLPPDQARAIEAELRQRHPGVEGDLAALVQAFLQVDDATLAERYAYFYQRVAPHIDLYAVRVGDVVTLRSFSKSGYIKAVNVKVYGTYAFDGLERSDLAGSANIVDMITFRQLYGRFTAEQAAEMKDIREAVGVEEVDREDAEAALFGEEAGPLVKEETPKAAAGFDEFAGVDLKAAATADNDAYDPAEIDQGLALNAAVLLDDPDRLDETALAIKGALARDKLPVQVTDWQTASGVIGQFIVVVRGVLYVAIGIIFLVALVIINNSMIMATMERIGEIGTMRAIGAQRRFVLWMFLVETVALGVLSGGLGALLGAGAVTWLGKVGIPATADVLVLLFAGPRLHPTVGASHLAVAVAVILVVSLASTLYPAFVATRVQPIEAMRSKE